ncbi:MAG: hypothetical protein H6737_18415 [Alphaproteobacteria bacterium]|nr:hypothetical protein [Alphaproteobacteria bacterium]
MIPRLALFAGILAASPAIAKDTAGRVGVGADAAFTGGPAAHITWWAASPVAIQGTVGFALTGGNVGDSLVMLLGVGGLFKVVDTERVNLEIQVTTSVAAGDADLVRFEPGLRPELFVTDDLSVHATVGIAVSVTGDDGFGGLPANSTSVQLGVGGLLSSAGFTFYF